MIYALRIEAFRCGYCRSSFTASEMMKAYRRGKCECGEPADSWQRIEQLYPVLCCYCQNIIAYKPVEHSHGQCDPPCPQARQMLGERISNRLTVKT